MGRLLTAILVGLLVSAMALAGQAPRDPQAEAGWAALEKGDANRAAAAFEAALSGAHRIRCCSLARERRRISRAVIATRGRSSRFLHAQPELIPPRSCSASHYLQGDLEGAIRRYEEALPFAAPSWCRRCKSG